VCAEDGCVGVGDVCVCPFTLVSCGSFLSMTLLLLLLCGDVLLLRFRLLTTVGSEAGNTIVSAASVVALGIGEVVELLL